MSTITGTTINNGVTISNRGDYASPLTITSTGAIVAGSGIAIYGPPTAAWAIVNYGTVVATAAVAIELADGGSIDNVGTAALLAACIGIAFKPPLCARAGSVAADMRRADPADRKQ
jgi:hypothetical protein